MRRWSWTAVLTTCILATPVTAQQVPMAGQAVDEKENSSLNYECRSQQDQLHCEFVQTMVQKGEVAGEAQLSEQASQLLDSGFSPADCDQYRGALQTLTSGGDFGQPLGELARTDGVDLIGTFVAFCDLPNAASALAALKAAEAKKARTCSVSTFRFELTFSWDPQRNRWESVTPPTGPCGVVTAAFFEPEVLEATPDYPFWNYRQQKVVTNREGEDALFGKCSAWPESQSKYNWRSRELLLQCDYLKFGLF